MRQLLYVSNACDIAPGDLDNILTTSRRHNALMGVTGLLLFIDGGFLQMLEGEEISVRTLYTRIAADRRHFDPRLMLDREVAVRAFPEWSMGFERGMFGVAREAIHNRLAPGTGRIVAMMLHTFYRVQCSDLPLNLYYAG